MKILLLVLVSIIVLLSACDPCRKLAKSKIIAEKDSAAVCYYSRKQYESAALLLEELMGLYRGTTRMEEIMFLFAYAKYYNGDFVSSAYYFSDFGNVFPHSKNAEEAAFMAAQSYAMQSSAPPLDQSETQKAIERFQLFTQIYPNGKRLAQANEQIQKLRDKLATKAFANANLYFKTRHYQSAAVAFKNVISDFPDSPYREEAQFRLFASAYYYAYHSIAQKQEARYLEAVNYYNRYIDKFPNGKFSRDAEALYIKAQNALQNLNKTPQNTEEPN